MRSQMSKNEMELRSRFDFSKGVRGKFYERYKNGHTVTLLDGDPDEDDPLDLTTRQAGRHIFVSQVKAAGFKLAEPLSDESIDYLIYSAAGRNHQLVSYAVKLKTSSSKTFYLYKKYADIPRFLLVYIWNARGSEESSVYALTYEEALRIVEAKGYAKSEAWVKQGGYSVTHAGTELKEMLNPYRMTLERWQQKLRVA
jgi:hypothetical protein